jgi:hypothetical protein
VGVGEGVGEVVRVGVGDWKINLTPTPIVSYIFKTCRRPSDNRCQM